MAACLCCGLDTEIESKPLCFYCYHRSNTGAAKMLMFKAIMEHGNSFFTADEITQFTNELRESLGIKPVKKPAIMKILRQYSEFYDERKKKGGGYLMLVHKRKVPTSCKPINVYKLGATLQRRLIEYEKRWKNGFIINIQVSKGRRWRRKQDHSVRARAIYHRIRKEEIGLYQFLLYGQRILQDKNPHSIVILKF